MGDPSANVSLWTYFQQGGVAMYPLILCSILSMAICLDRIIVLYRAGNSDAGLDETLRAQLANNQIREAADRCGRSMSSLGRIARASLMANDPTAEHRQKVLERAVARESARLERRMSVLATIGSISPFVGLFGTVLGIMRAFRDIGIAGSAGGAVVATGVAEALITTAAGLFVAIIAVIAYNHLATWARGIVRDAELGVEELLSLVKSES